MKWFLIVQCEEISVLFFAATLRKIQDTLNVDHDQQKVVSQDGDLVIMTLYADLPTPLSIMKSSRNVQRQNIILTRNFNLKL